MIEVQHRYRRSVPRIAIFQQARTSPRDVKLTSYLLPPQRGRSPRPPLHISPRRGWTHCDLRVCGTCTQTGVSRENWYPSCASRAHAPAERRRIVGSDSVPAGTAPRSTVPISMRRPETSLRRELTGWARSSLKRSTADSRTASCWWKRPKLKGCNPWRCGGSSASS